MQYQNTEKLKFCTFCGFRVTSVQKSPCSNCSFSTDEKRLLVPTKAFIFASLYGNNGWQQWVACCLGIVLIWQLIGVLPLVAICGIVNYLEFQEYTCRTDSLSITGPSHVPGFTLSILPFVIGLIGMFYLLKWIHGKKLVNCLTGRKKIDFERVLFAMFIVAFMSGISLLIELSSETGTSARAEITRNPVDINFLFLAIVALFFVPIQAGLEEIFFRGYILQGISLISKSKIFLILSTSAIFTVVHLANPEPWEYGVYTYATTIFMLGTFMGLITLLDGGLELAIGFHTMNNLWSFLIVGLETSVISTPALFILSIEKLELIPTVIPGIIQFMLLTGIFGWRYGWFARSKARQMY